MNLNSSFDPARVLTTTTPGGPPAAVERSYAFNPISFMGGLDPALLAQIVDAKLKRDQRAAPNRRSTFGGGMGDAPEMRMPTLGQAPVDPTAGETTRWVPNPHLSKSARAGEYHGAGQRLYNSAPPPLVKERFIGGRWEFDNVDPYRR